MLPQSAQNFVLSLCLVKGLNDVNLFCTSFSSRQSQQVQLLQYYLLDVDRFHLYTPLRDEKLLFFILTANILVAQIVHNAVSLLVDSDV